MRLGLLVKRRSTLSVLRLRVATVAKVDRPPRIKRAARDEGLPLRSRMSNQTRQVLEQALRLPRRERTTLVAELMRTLDADGGEGLTKEEREEAWGAEIDRRVREIREGKAELIDGDEALKMVRGGHKPKRRQ